MQNIPEDPLGVTLIIEQTYVHPSYDGSSSYFDIGIIKTQNVTFNEVVRPICLPQRAEPNTDIHRGKAAQLIGKLLASLGDLQMYLSTIFLTIVSYNRR